MRAPLLLGLLLATTALAAPRPKVIIDAPAPMKALLTKTLKKKFTPVPPKSALPDEPGSSAVKQAVREAGAVALVTARLQGGVWTVMALNGADGAPLEQFKFRAPPKKKPLRALPKGTAKRLVSALGKAKAPAKEKKEEPKEEPAEEPKKEVEPVVVAEPKRTEQPKEEVPVKEVEKAAERVDDSARPVALNVGIGAKVFARRFFYNQDIFQALSKYNLPAGPALQLEADWFPGAHFTRGLGAQLGLSLGLTYALGISSVAKEVGTETMIRYGTSAVRLRLGLIGRITFGRIELQPQAGWVLQNYNIASGASRESKPNIPDVRYSNLRAGLGTKINLIGPLSITAGFAYQIPLSTGEISSANYFPRLSAGGLDANFGVAVGPLFERAEIRLGIDYIRYWYTMNPEPGDVSVAGGALDDYRGLGLIVAFVL